MRKLIIYCLLVCLLIGCGDSNKQKNEPDFTLMTGVSVLKFESCSKPHFAKDPIIRKDLNAYIVAIDSLFACETDQLQPYLTLSINRRATLVIPKNETAIGFKSNCECQKSLLVRLEGRVERGDTLYVAHDSDVLGHVVVP